MGTLRRSTHIKFFHPGGDVHVHSTFSPPLFMDEVLSEDMVKKDNEMGANIPGGNFPGGNFPGVEFDEWEFSRGNFPTISNKNCETRIPSPIIQCWLQIDCSFLAFSLQMGFNAFPKFF